VLNKIFVKDYNFLITENESNAIFMY
jgi:hypothetical protein